MILQALNSYYQRLLDDPGQDIAEPGFSSEKIHFELVLKRDGSLAGDPRNLQTLEGKKLLPKKLTVPAAVKRSSGIAPNRLWDNTGYVLGADAKDKPERAGQQFESFRALQHELLDGVDDDGARAFLAFLDTWSPARAASLGHWDELAGKNVVFRLEGDARHIHDRPAVRQALQNGCGEKDCRQGVCLVTGELAPIARLHASIKGVRGAQSSGAALVSFNLDAFTSHGKEQNYNAPVSEQAAFAYTTALNHMLAQNSRQRVQVGDATTVFWSEKPSKVEDFFAAAMGGAVDSESSEAHDSGLLADLRSLLEALREGGRAPAWDVDPQTPFYILGLSPNASRLSVRFWQASTVEGIMRRLAEHYRDLEMESRYENEPRYPGIFRLLLETVPARRKADGRTERKADDIQPLLGGEIMRSILTGGEYPRSLLSKIIGRFRADGEVTYLRAALLKAHFSRLARLGKPSKEVSVSLDPNNTDIGYCLGRLFAVLEKAQQDALPGINTTIKDRFYGAASATPASVFPRLIRLSQHHIGKAEYGHLSDRRLGEIMDGIAEFPRHLDMDEQAMFALGYYHQRNALWRKKTEETPAASQA